MAIIFFPKTVVLSDEVIKKLEENFNFSHGNIEEVRYWNGTYSPHTGVIINTEKEAQYKVYPFGKSIKDFFKQYPTGKVWE